MVQIESRSHAIPLSETRSLPNLLWQKSAAALQASQAPGLLERHGLMLEASKQYGVIEVKEKEKPSYPQDQFARVELSWTMPDEQHSSEQDARGVCVTSDGSGTISVDFFGKAHIWRSVEQSPEFKRISEECQAESEMPNLADKVAIARELALK